LSHLDSTGWVAALFVSVVACVLCYYVLYWLVMHVPGHRLAIFEELHGISAMILGVYLFQDPVNAWMLAGGACVLLGLGMISLTKNHHG